MGKENTNRKRLSIRGMIIVAGMTIILAGVVYYRLFVCIAEFKGMRLIYKCSI